MHSELKEQAIEIKILAKTPDVEALDMRGADDNMTIISMKN